ncbi:hypothetical protein V5O48_018334, partial [Marasmius crinis-equi]
MPFKPVKSLHLDCANHAEDKIYELWGALALRKHQVQAGRNNVLGKNTVLDVPTRGGKTLAFWYPIFYHLSGDPNNAKNFDNLLVISPLDALMESQMKDLEEKGVPAIALSSSTENLENRMN